MKKLWLLSVPAVFFALVLVSACTPDILVYEQTNTSPPVPEPYPGSYTHPNTGMYGIWYHMGRSAIILPPKRLSSYSTIEPSFAEAISPESKWKLTLNRDNTWSLAFLSYTEYDEDPVEGENSIVPSAVEAGTIDYDETGGYTLYHFLASGNYFEFNGTDKITFIINSTASQPVFDPPERLTVTIAEVEEPAPSASASGNETGGTTTNTVDKYNFVPTEETAIRFGTVIRIDVAFAGEWERR